MCLNVHMHVQMSLRTTEQMAMLEHVQGLTRHFRRTRWPRKEVISMDANRGPGRPVSHFAEADYCYGTGLLAIRVERVDWAKPVQYDGDTWYEVDGVELTTDGREIGRRQVLVRGSRLSTLPRNRRA